MAENESEAILAIDKALSKISDGAARNRILTWAIDKYGEQVGESPPMIPGKGETKLNIKGNEIPGIAILQNDGTIKWTIRDIKAKNANDAGLRLSLVAAYINEKLTGQNQTSRKSIINPLLNDWRIYNGNIRKTIRDYKGIITDGDLIKLDTHAKKEAQGILEEIIDPSIEGQWSPGKVGQKAKKAKKKAAKKASKKKG